MAKKAASVKKAMTKSEMFSEIAAGTGLAKKEVASVFDELETEGAVVRRAEVVGRSRHDEDVSTVFVALTPEERGLLEKLPPASLKNLRLTPPEDSQEEGERTTTLAPQLRELLESAELPEEAPVGSPETAAETIEP